MILAPLQSTLIEKFGDRLQFEFTYRAYQIIDFRSKNPRLLGQHFGHICAHNNRVVVFLLNKNDRFLSIDFDVSDPKFFDNLFMCIDRHINAREEL